MKKIIISILSLSLLFLTGCGNDVTNGQTSVISSDQNAKAGLSPISYHNQVLSQINILTNTAESNINTYELSYSNDHSLKTLKSNPQEIKNITSSTQEIINSLTTSNQEQVTAYQNFFYELVKLSNNYSSSLEAIQSEVNNSTFNTNKELFNTLNQKVYEDYSALIKAYNNFNSFSAQYVQ